MRRHATVLLNLLVILGLVLSGLLVGGPVPSGTTAAPGAAPEPAAEVAGDPALASKRAKVKRERRDDRRQDAEQKRQQDRAKTERGRKQDDRRKDRQQDRKKARQSQAQGRVGDWQEYCSGPETIQLRENQLCTHGPDEAPAGFDIAQDVPPLSDAVAAEQAGAVACDGDGQSGYRTQVLYVYGSDRPNKYNTYHSSIQAWASEMDLIFRTSAAATGPTRSVRFVQDQNTCAPIVVPVQVSPAGDGNFSTTINELYNNGFNRVDRIYLLFVDTNVYCGIGNWWDDDRIDGNVNYSNYGPSYARVDRGCWSGDVAAHEVMHNLGGVQDSAPHSSFGAHCIDEWDIMCYSDSPHYPQMQYLCPVSTDDSTVLDCNHDDYYHTNPAPGSYLATHWNPANNRFLTNAPEPPPPPPPPPPPTLDSGGTDDGAWVGKHKKHKKKKKKRR